MGPAQWGNTSWQKLISQSQTNQQSQRLLNWIVQPSMKQFWISWRGKEVEELQVSLQSNIIIDIQVHPYWQKWQTKCSNLAANDIESFEIHEDMCDRYLVFGFVLAHITWNAISILEPQWSYKTLCNVLGRPSAMTVSNIHSREYALTLDAITKQMLSRNKVCVPSDKQTSTTKLAITAVIAYCMDQNYALRELELTVD
jgi:hypothetical protein